MTDQPERSCETCDLRRKTEARPRSLVGILWKVHTWFCPGWKAYRRSLAESPKG